MQHALEELDGRYGGVTDYLKGPAGVQPDDLAALQRRLVQESR
jgi:hypothetical protein